MFVTKSGAAWRKCRLCMASDTFMIFLFEKSGELTNLAKAITELLQYRVSCDDKYPSYVCSKCSDKLWEFRDFKESCDNTKKAFEEIFSSKSKYTGDLGNHSLVKQEPELSNEKIKNIWAEGKIKLEIPDNDDDTKKFIFSPKQICIKEEEKFDECPIEHYKVFIESLAGGIMEEDSKIESDSGMEVSKHDTVNTEGNQEEKDIDIPLSQEFDSETNPLSPEDVVSTKEAETISLHNSPVQCQVEDFDSDMNPLKPDNVVSTKEPDVIGLDKSPARCEVEESDSGSQLSITDNVTSEEEPERMEIPVTEDSDSCSQLSKTDNVTTEKGTEGAGSQTPLTKNPERSIPVAEPRTISATPVQDPNVSEESLQLRLSDSECEVLQSSSVGASVVVRAKKKICTKPTACDSACDVEVLDTVITSQRKGHEDSAKEKAPCDKDAIDSDCEVQVLTHNRGTLAKRKRPAHERDSDSDSDLEILVEDTINKRREKECAEKDRILERKRSWKQSAMTSYFVELKSPLREFRKKAEDSPVKHSMETSGQANITPITRVDAKEKENENVCLRESDSSKHQDKNSSETPDKEFRLLLRKNLNDVLGEDISQVSDGNGNVQLLYSATSLNKDDAPLLSETESDSVNNSKNSAAGTNSRNTSKECPAVGVTEKNQFCGGGCNSKQGDGRESFSFLSQYKAANEQKCNRCGKQFKNLSNLVTHVRMERTIHCHFCNLSFKSDKELLDHFPSHDGKVKWSCGDCGEISVQWTDVWKHLQSHRNKSHECDDKLSASNTKNTQGHSCKVCHKTLPNKRSLRMHLLSHSEQNKWVCPHCDENFCDKGSLVGHIETHNKLKY